jgi:hypothetical protein
MTLKLIEGFDHVSSPFTLGAKGWSVNDPVGAGNGLAMVTGRIAGRALNLFTSSNADNIPGLDKSLPATYTKVLIGFGLWLNARPLDPSIPFLQLRNGTTAILNLSQTSAGKLQVGGGTAGPTTIATGTWYFVELKVFINGASSTYELHLNSASEIASTVYSGGSTGINNISFTAGIPPAGFGSGHFNGQYSFDDLYVLDWSASPNNDFLGDVVVETILPSADGGHTDFTPNSGTAHFSRVNEASGTYPDDDTSYVASNTVGNRDSYAYGDLTTLAGTIFGVQRNLYLRKDSAGTRTVKPSTRISGTDYDGSAISPSTSYGYASDIQETNPATSAAWTISDVNGAEHGLKVDT